MRSPRPRRIGRALSAREGVLGFQNQEEHDDDLAQHHEFVFIQLRTFGRVVSARLPIARSTSSGKPINRAVSRKNGIARASDSSCVERWQLTASMVKMSVGIAMNNTGPASARSREKPFQVCPSTWGLGFRPSEEDPDGEDREQPDQGPVDVDVAATDCRALESKRLPKERRPPAPSRRSPLEVSGPPRSPSEAQAAGSYCPPALPRTSRRLGGALEHPEDPNWLSGGRP